MGGRAYLTRLAFGRSAYEPVSSTEVYDRAQPEVESAPYVQEYDNKGNPKNPEVARRTEAQIAAKNEVLAAVGVCERRNSEARQGKVTFTEEEWKTLQDVENGVGESGRIFAECLRHGASWWLVTLRKRLQVGIVSCDIPFSQILCQDWRAITSAGLRGGLRHLMRGAVPELAGQSISIVLEYIIEEIHMKACEIPFSLRLRRAQRQKWLRWIDRAKLYTLVFSQLLLSPLAISAALQQLGLVTSIPASNLLPWNTLSPLRWAWLERGDNLPLGSHLLDTLLSPASLWCLSNTFYQIIALNYGSTPFCPESLILGPEDHIRVPERTFPWGDKPAPTIFKPLSSLRNWILRRLDWSQEPRTAKLIEATETGDILDNGDGTFVFEPKRTHRQTELARFPSHFLALSIDGLINQLVCLPLESLYLRSLVSAFLAGPLATRGVRYYPPGNGPVGALLGKAIGPSEWRGAGAYANKIGLCVALQFSIDTAIWGGAFAWTKWMGVTKFHWGEV